MGELKTTGNKTTVRNIRVDFFANPVIVKMKNLSRICKSINKEEIIMKRIAVLLTAALVLTVGCMNEKNAIRDAVSRFWQAVIEGKTEAAYQMLSKESRFNVNKADFEDDVSFGLKTNMRTRELRKAWGEQCDFRIEELEQRGSEALVLVSFKVPDMGELADRIDQEAQREGIYRKYKDKPDKIDAWFAKRITEEIKAHRFSRTTLENETFLIREEGQWKIYYEY